MPASPVQRLLAGGIDILLVVGISGFLPISLVGRLTCAGLVLLVFIVVQSLTGVGPGGAVMGMRLHRVARGGNSPGLAALGRAGLIAVAAVAGGLLAAFVVHLLSGRTTTGFRLIVVGLAVSAALGAVNAYLVTRARVEDAMLVGFWGAGSLTRIEAGSLPMWLGAAAVLLVSAGLLAPSLGLIELGDQTAGALGIPLEPRRAILVVVGVAASAVVTAAAGPIGFVALAAPQVARRLMRTPGISIAGAAVTGAVLLSAAQLCSALASSNNRPVPVGLITVSVGGLYLIYLLVRGGRRSA